MFPWNFCLKKKKKSPSAQEGMVVFLLELSDL